MHTDAMDEELRKGRIFCHMMRGEDIAPNRERHHYNHVYQMVVDPDGGYPRGAVFTQSDIYYGADVPHNYGA